MIDGFDYGTLDPRAWHERLPIDQWLQPKRLLVTYRDERTGEIAYPPYLSIMEPALLAGLTVTVEEPEIAA